MGSVGRGEAMQTKKTMSTFTSSDKKEENSTEEANKVTTSVEDRKR
jgi:hypothetical protein